MEGLVFRKGPSSERISTVAFKPLRAWLTRSGGGSTLTSRASFVVVLFTTRSFVFSGLSSS